MVAILSRLQELSEPELTQRVVIPIFQAMGYETVYHHGGQLEEGKDIVGWRRGEIGDIELMVAQVKKLKPSSCVADKKGFSSLINQLEQCYEKEITYRDGQNYLPEIVYFITPYEITPKTIRTRIEKLRELRRVKIINGPCLLTLLENHLPNLLDDLGSPHSRIRTVVQERLTNQALLCALELPSGRAVHSFFTDIDFSIGRPSAQRLFCSLKGTQGKVMVDLRDWPRFREVQDKVRKDLACELYEDRSGEIDRLFAEKSQEHEKWWRLHCTMTQERDEIQRQRDLSEKETKELQECINRIGTQENNDEMAAKLVNVRETYNKVVTNLQELENRIQESLRGEPQFKQCIIVNGKVTAEKLTEARDQIVDSIRDLNIRPSISSLRSLLIRSAALFAIGKELLRIPDVARCLGLLNGGSRVVPIQQTRVQASILDLFATGQNVTLLGTAGAGKTTALQMYAYDLIAGRSPSKKIVLFVPLSRAVARPDLSKQGVILQTPSTEKIIDPYVRLQDMLVYYLNSLGVNIGASDFEREIEKRGGVLLLDGIDEAIQNAPWIINAIERLGVRFPQVQIVTSSRMTGLYVENLPFLNVVILPFNDSQRESFIRKWFVPYDNRRCQEVLAHLKATPQIAEVARVPLLTTILCVLAQYGLKLPESEVCLYDERLKLLLGYYDFHKGIKRVLTHTSHLETLARKLAFMIHQKGRRSIGRLEAKQVAVSALKHQLDEPLALRALEELIDPCNVLLPTTEGKELTFDHLRYQEHLAAREIVSNRGIDIYPLMRQDWWRGAFQLFAQMSQDVDAIIEKLRDAGAIVSVADTVRVMAKVGSGIESDRLEQIIDVNRMLDESPDMRDVE